MQSHIRNAGLRKDLVRIPPLRKDFIQASRLAEALDVLPRGSADVVQSSRLHYLDQVAAGVVKDRNSDVAHFCRLHRKSYAQ